jgi:hypothetical protein
MRLDGLREHYLGTLMSAGSWKRLRQWGHGPGGDELGEQASDGLPHGGQAW